MRSWKRKTVYFCTTTILLALFLTFSQSFAAERNTSAQALSLKDFIKSGLSKQIGQTKEQIFAELGAPQSLTSRAIRNIHYPKSSDQIHTLTYDGLQIILYESSVSKQQFVVSIAIENPAINTKLGPKVGSQKDVVLAMLGTPKRMTSRQLVYYDHENGSSSVSFALADNKVREIRWDYHFE